MMPPPAVPAPASALALDRVANRSMPHFVAPGGLRDFTWALAASVLVVTGCMCISDAMHHWFVVPVVLCGALVGVDALAWLTGRVDPFNPIGVMGVIGVHFFFAAPLLHVLMNFWMPYVEPPPDWRPWLGWMATLNVVGLVAFRQTKRFLTIAWHAVPTRTIWRLDPRRFAVGCSVMMIAAAIIQVAVYAKFGGIAGYMQAFTESAENFAGFGQLFIISESFPILALIAMIVWAQRSPHRRTWLVVAAMMFSFIALKLFFGGLRGSRGHLVYGFFWAAGLVHFMVRPISKKFFFAGALTAVVFMYAYGFYKTYGANTIEAIASSDGINELGKSTNRSFGTVVLGDLGRADVHAFLLYRLSPECRTSRYQYVLGETYLSAITLLIPKSVLSDRPLSKQFVGTEALFGREVGTLAPMGDSWDFLATFAYGAAGEAMLNFGPVGALVSFIPLALVTVWACNWRDRMDKDDVRQFLTPFVATLPFMTLMWDSDVLVFYTVKEAFVVAALLFFASRSAARSWSMEMEVER